MCLWTKGLEEKKKMKTSEHKSLILAQIVPDMELKMDEAVDVHTVRRKMDNKSRYVIVVPFAQRRVKEEI